MDELLAENEMLRRALREIMQHMAELEKELSRIENMLAAAEDRAARWHICCLKALERCGRRM